VDAEIEAIELLIVAFTMPMIAVFVSLVFLPAVILGISRLMLRYIDIIVPPVTNEIDRLAAGIIFAAVLAPVLLMTRRHVQVHRLINNAGRHGSNHDGSRVNEFGLREASDVNASIKTGLADADRHTDIGCLCCDGTKDDHDGEQKMFHTSLSFIDVRTPGCPGLSLP
jgi:hypothetical protein